MIGTTLVNMHTETGDRQLSTSYTIGSASLVKNQWANILEMVRVYEITLLGRERIYGKTDFERVNS